MNSYEWTSEDTEPQRILFYDPNAKKIPTHAALELYFHKKNKDRLPAPYQSSSDDSSEASSSSDDSSSSSQESSATAKKRSKARRRRERRHKTRKGRKKSTKDSS